MTVHVVNLPIDVPNTNRLPDSLLQEANVLEKVHIPCCSLAPLAHALQVTIGKLSDEVLLNIFRYYLDASPRFWPRLVHICRRWRRIVYLFQQALHLRLHFTHGTPVQKTLDSWPDLPIVVQYGGSPALGSPDPEDEDNNMTALERSDRVISLSLTVASSLRKKLSAIENFGTGRPCTSDPR